MMSSGFSVVICCFNSGGRISETLKYVFDLNTENRLVFEVIVINNNSTDDTVFKAASAAQKFNTRKVAFKIVDESSIGLNAARTRGLSEAKHEFIVYCDDDNHLHPQYLVNAWTILNERTEVGILGGWNRPPLFKNKPVWLEDFCGSLAIEKEPKGEGEVKWIFGAGMIVSIHLFETIKQKQIKLLLTDRAGDKQSSGGDIELCLLARLLGYQVYYSPTLQLVHQISETRLKLRNFLWIKTDNFMATVHLYVMERLIENKNVKFKLAISEYSMERFSRSLRALPRLIAGRRIVLNFVEFYGNIMLIGWILLNIKRIKSSFDAINSNLYTKI